MPNPSTRSLVRFCSIFFTAWSAFAVSFPTVGTAQQDPKTAQSNTLASTDSLVQDFLRIAFSEHHETDLFITPPQRNSEGVPTFTSYERLTNAYPWFSEYLYSIRGEPKTRVLNRWVQPVTISTGWPNDLKPYTQFRWKGENHPDYYLTSYAGSHDAALATLVQDEVNKLIPLLTSITGLNIEYIPHDYEQPDKWARVRILFFDRITEGGNRYKQGIGHVRERISTSSWPKPINFRDLEATFSGLVYFTPDTNRQVEGYFIPNSDNEIAYAACYIWRKHPETLTRGLIRECLVRSLGLPDAVRTLGSTNSLLTYWNDPTKWPAAYAAKLPDVPPSISNFDQFIIQTLYKKDLEPGIAPMEAQRILRGVDY